MRVEDPSIEIVENGIVQLTLNWKSRRPYERIETPKAQKFHMDVFLKMKKEVKSDDRFKQDK